MSFKCVMADRTYTQWCFCNIDAFMDYSDKNVAYSVKNYFLVYDR